MPIDPDQLPARNMLTPCSSSRTCLPDLQLLQFHNHALKRADSHLSAARIVRWNALTESTFRRHTNSRSEVERWRARQCCKRHPQLFCHKNGHLHLSVPQDLCQTTHEPNFSIRLLRRIGTPHARARTLISENQSADLRSSGAERLSPHTANPRRWQATWTASRVGRRWFLRQDHLRA